jgi:predicted O-methyltransferase YrrM
MIIELEKIYSTTPAYECDVISELIECVPQDAVIVEIGTGGGRVTALLAYACVGTRRRVYTIDSGEEKNRYRWHRDPKEVVEELGLGQYVQFIEGKSQEAWKDVGKQVDFLFIDGSHKYSDVLADILNWYPLMKKGGIISIHDFDPGCEDGRQVIKAIFDSKVLGGFGEYMVMHRVFWKVV